jgi:hypothetical protein
MMDGKLLEKAGAVAALVASLVGAVAMYAKREYRSIVASNNVTVDEWTNSSPSTMEMIQAVIAFKLASRYNKSDEAYPIAAQESANVKGLLTTRRAKEGESLKSNKTKPPLIIGTMRMGFGHERIAQGVASWALDACKQDDRDVYFHDIVNINSPEADFVSEAETLYSHGSRLMTEQPHFMENRISKMTSSGGTNALRIQCLVASIFMSVLAGLDKNSPIISTHPLVGAIAVAAGFHNVVNLVVDNHAQWFVVVPGALNLVQGPRAYQELVKLGVPPQEMELAGHWCHKQIVKDIPQVVDRRIRRLQNGKPLRLLIPVGGAGAQESLLKNLVRACTPLVKSGKVQLFLNAGDHSHMKEMFEKQLDDSKLDFELITTVDDLRSFRQQLEANESNEPRKPVTLFAYKSLYLAVSTTDDLANVSDVLVCKPSEMAFYSTPKLMIRRVGDHEQKSALRAAELGDGTLEARTVPEIMKNVHVFLDSPQVLINMNKSIEKNHDIEIYQGLKIAVTRALDRANEHNA